MKKANLLLLILLIGCVAPKNKTGLSNQQMIAEYLDNKEFEKARTFTAQNRITEYWGPKRIEASERCSGIVEKCAHLEQVQQARLCLVELQSCDSRYLSPKIRSEVNGAIEKASSFKQISPCSKRWGYSTKKTCHGCAKSLSPDYSALVGQFESKDKCEEERLKDSTAADDTCHQRIVENSSSKVWEAQAIVSGHKPSKLPLMFSNKEKCEAAVNTGIVYVSRNHRKIEVKPAGQANDYNAKFISGCEQKSVPTCVANRPEPEDIGDIL